MFSLTWQFQNFLKKKKKLQSTRLAHRAILNFFKCIMFQERLYRPVIFCVALPAPASAKRLFLGQQERVIDQNVDYNFEDPLFGDWVWPGKSFVRPPMMVLSQESWPIDWPASTQRKFVTANFGLKIKWIPFQRRYWREESHGFFRAVPRTT